MIFFEKGKVWADASEHSYLIESFFGKKKGKKIFLSPVEALYLAEMRNEEIVSIDTKTPLSLHEIYEGVKPNLTLYFVYKDWKERGLFLLPFSSSASGEPKPALSYKSSPVCLPPYTLSGIFSAETLTAYIPNPPKTLYTEYWFGQLGDYKAEQKGKSLKLDVFETAYLSKKGLLSVPREFFRIASSRLPDFEDMLSVYSDWRDHGYVVKTGFKFGSHFRIYFPGAKPGFAGAWKHSKHVLHVFSEKDRLLVSEWARAVRVAHSVKKTFILGMKPSKASSRAKPHFAAFSREGTAGLTPATSKPSYALLCLHEDQYIGGKDFASYLASAEKAGLTLLVAIVDRETSVTYYEIKRIQLAESPLSYFEIAWVQP
ncbi:MAG: tRNA-intron lyase [Candidatus Anstonellales archaeon]